VAEKEIGTAIDTNLILLGEVMAVEIGFRRGMKQADPVRRALGVIQTHPKKSHLGMSKEGEDETGQKIIETMFRSSRMIKVVQIIGKQLVKVVVTTGVGTALAQNLLKMSSAHQSLINQS
jgi:hypothetical protein